MACQFDGSRRRRRGDAAHADRGAGVDARWLVLQARNDFFRFTKRLHALLHGQGVAPPGPDDRRLYEEVTLQAAGEMLAAVAPDDVVILHDPQTAGLTAAMAEAGAIVIWRGHVGADVPNEAVRSAWRFLLPYVARADAYVFTRDAFIPSELRGSRAWRLTPAIEPGSARLVVAGRPSMRSPTIRKRPRCSPRSAACGGSCPQRTGPACSSPACR